MNEKGLNDNIISLIKGVFINYPNISKAILFGSRAKGTARDNSDIDIAVMGVKDKLQIEKIAMDLEELPLPYKFDVQAYEGIGNKALKEHIDRVGIVVYEEKSCKKCEKVFAAESFREEDFLMLSGIQHMAFCERQWALIHIEQVWAENVSTVEGKHLHERADDPFKDESRKNVRIVRSMPLISRQFGLCGVADVVEFYKSDEYVAGKTCKLAKRAGWWRPAPVEYKRGRPKVDDRDKVQLCAQAMALEEMLTVTIDVGYLFYWQTKHREEIQITDDLRKYTGELAERMHMFVREGITPKAQSGKRCSKCSLVEQCQPNWVLKPRSVSDYLQKMCRVEVNDS